MTSSQERAGLLGQVAIIARRASEAILATTLGEGDIERKDDGSPVTRADRASHEIILAGLRNLRLPWPIVSEEDDLHALPPSGATYWLVDPLDGTKEFVKGLPEYTVNVALIEADEAVLGVVDVPPAGCLFTGAMGVGARRDRASESSSLVPSDAERPRTAVVSRSHPSPATLSFLEALGITESVPRGSSLKICAVAEGAADIYPRLGPIRLWDTAAGVAVARAAGCVVMALDGSPLRYDPAGGLVHSGLVVAAPRCADRCREALRAQAKNG
jgi:3'(2'), 5'-bisphosphate nucleotidase